MLIFKDQPFCLLESASFVAHNVEDSDVEDAVVEDSDVSSGASYQTTVHRGMTVQTREGDAVGHVAAVVLDPARQEVTHLLLVQEHPLLEYRLIPVALIQQVGNERVQLHILQPAVNTLPVWHSV